MTNDQCKGCFMGDEPCPLNEYIKDKCPCKNCLVKTSCSKFCKPFRDLVAKFLRSSKSYEEERIREHNYIYRRKRLDGTTDTVMHLRPANFGGGDRVVTFSINSNIYIYTGKNNE